jgi:hypothetical protein
MPDAWQTEYMGYDALCNGINIQRRAMARSNYRAKPRSAQRKRPITVLMIPWWKACNIENNKIKHQSIVFQKLSIVPRNFFSV